ncbi:transglutaminase [Parathermosynechococcus lividus PCC 6715]|uniref:Transglutaminase n=1 Tax=Parathermosynechococcus lividus PCC 6715 TaxID=1917166 RepID=A0A2D2Q305_PARLV|nr:transglutaminase [Thermostichus lividus PCC 6715]
MFQAWLRPISASPMLAPAKHVEDSLILRLGVLCMVIVGIVATDIAAETQTSVWAIPLSIAGFSWSWWARRQRNVVAKLAIALGMVIALVVFLGRLAALSHDSRLLLAELLIQLQVLHSFDLPRRKDLGYSMVIALILISVAATLSQTMMFGVFLLVFLAIALPVLVLDYRSRLGLLPLAVNSLGMSWRQWFGLFVLILSLGLGVFVVLPRFPGYQIRTLPVSAEIQVDGEFDQTRVINPGYVSGRGGAGVGEELANQQFDSNFYYGFGSEIDQTLGGVMTPQEILRVRSQAPGFWRVLAFDEYTGRGWRISTNDAAEILRRSPWSFRYLLPQLPTRVPTREVIQTYTVVSEFSNLIPHLYDPRELYFPTREIARDPEGGLRAPVPLPEGLTYSVISHVPVRDRSVLRTAGKIRNPAAYRQYLQVPEALTPRLQTLAQDLLAKADRPIEEPYEQALYLTQALKQSYRLDTQIPKLAAEQDLVATFLFEWQGGYPDHFASALTLLLRSIGIPARLVTGLGTGEFNPFTGLYIVRNTDAYALTEAYFPELGWFLFDPIPGHDLYPATLEVDQTFSVLQQFWNWVTGWLPTPVTGFFGTLFAALESLLTQFMDLFSQGLGGIIQGILLLCGAAIALWFGIYLWQSWRYRQRLRRLSAIEQLYVQMLDWLAQQGFPKRNSQTPWEYAQYLRDVPQLDSLSQRAIDTLTHAYVSWRYGGAALPLPALRRALGQLKDQRWRSLQHTATHLNRLMRKGGSR